MQSSGEFPDAGTRYERFLGSFDCTVVRFAHNTFAQDDIVLE